MQQGQEPPRALSESVALHWIWGCGTVDAPWWHEAEDEPDPYCRAYVCQVDPQFDPEQTGAWIKRWVGSEAQLWSLIAGCRAVLNAAHFEPDPARPAE